MDTTTITVKIELEVTPNMPFDLAAFEEGVAHLAHDYYATEGAELHGFEEVSATIEKIIVNGKTYDPKGQVLV